jgi:TonB-linked SusC/RagA family outer membrane protein
MRLTTLLSVVTGVLLLLTRGSPATAQTVIEQASYAAAEWQWGRADDRDASGLDREVTLNLKNAPLATALQEIAGKAGVRLTYSDAMLPPGRRISLRVERITAADAVVRVLRDTDLEVVITPTGQAALVRRRPQAEVRQGTITGRVTDASTGEPLQGAQVAVVDTRFTALTATDGSYTMTGVPAGMHRVRASRIGYVPRTDAIAVSAGQTATANFALELQAIMLEGVVAVGYGTQKKVNLTGSVDAVGGQELEKRPVANVSEALQGIAPGMTVIDRGGRPGDAGTTVRIRGIGTLGNANPLLVVDGIPRNSITDLNDIDSNDVESISVLKDAASAAIYGSRAANGVVLVTTKRGSRDGELKLSYDGYYGIQGVAALPKRVGMEDYMRLINVSHVNAGLAPKYSEEHIQNTLSGADPLKYPSTDWIDVLFNPAPLQDHSVRLSGGNDLGAFSLSLNAMDQGGMLPNTHADRYGLRLNTDWNITERFDAGLDVALRTESNDEPHNIGGVYHQMFHGTPPMTVAKYPDGKYDFGDTGWNPLAAAETSGLRTREYTHGLVSAKANYALFDGLTLRTNASVQHGSWNYEDFRNENVFYDYWDPDRIVQTWAPNAMWTSKANDVEVNLRGMLDYGRTLGDHAVGALLGYEQIAHDWDEVGASREAFYNNELREINTGDASRDDNWGRSEAWRLRSGFGRLNYNWKNRYLLEANARYDGSSRFARGNEYGFFPSFSAGWRISEEPFMEPLGFISDLKLRASWGRLGNQDIRDGNRPLLYPYWSTISLGQNYNFDGQLVNGAAPLRLANEDVSWETTEMANLGLDAEFFDGRLAFTGDIYQKNTDGILLTLPIPTVIGLQAPVQNAGEVRNTGWETSLTWRDVAGELNYSLGFNLADVRNEIVSLAGTGPYISEVHVIREGSPIGALYALEALGMFQTKEEVANHARQHPLTGPGDLKYKDQNGDGIINNDDKIVVGSDLPRYTLGSNLTASYKGFDASVFFQGVLKVDAYIFGALTEGPIWENYTVESWLDHWTPETPDAKMPKPTLRLSVNTGPFARNSFWVRDASYIKLKNAQLGYSLPRSLTERLGVDQLRIYASGANLLTFTNLDFALDPEFPSGRATVYPQTRTVSIGTNVTF